MEVTERMQLFERLAVLGCDHWLMLVGSQCLASLGLS